MRWTVLDDFAPESVCADLIDTFHASIHDLGWRNKVDFWSYRLINTHDLPPGSESRKALEEIQEQVVAAIAGYWQEKARVQASQLVIWPTDTAQAEHTDRFFSDTRFAAIVYLNSDCTGGETFLHMPSGVERVRPATGRALIFEGTRIAHGVEQIRSGTRYTNALWLA